ncbi:MAG: iron-siderophore ABC transporter substrate-binding protein [Cyanobacteria bacterium J06649_4]
MVYLNLDRDTIADIGDARQPNLETLSALQSDLILTTQQIGESSYSLLSQISPTVVLAIDERANWREATRLCSEALDKQTEAETLSADYEEKLAQLKAEASQTLGDIETSVVYIRPGEIRTMGKISFPGSVLSDTGLSRPSVQAQGPDRRNISLESLDQIDGDVMFILTPQSNSEQATAVKAEIERIKATPLWSQLQAVKNGQIYEVAPYWALGNYIAANLVVDDLIAYFTESP